MTYKIKQEFKDAPLEMRAAYNNTMTLLAKTNPNIVLVEADLMGAIKTNGFMKAFPERFVNVGIMEQNMMGVASGLSLRGLTPYVHTFGPFATRRCFDQVFLAIGYAGLDVKIIGSDAGITASHNGGTHMPFEDLGLMRLIPNAFVLEISDHVMFEDILTQTQYLKGLFYLRIIRKQMMQIYEEGSTFVIGKGIVLREGKDATIVATGIMLKEALLAHDLLKKEGISVSVLDMFTIKPLDKSLLLEYAKKTKFIVTCDNHNIIGGLGSAVLEALSEDFPTKVIRLGVKDRFGQVGPQEFLQEEYELRAIDIVRKVKENL
ncbi:MAG: transketolase family protein [Firmicutes bacterium]|nr:transketolase family protein [Bacillota bacterium]